MGRVREEKRRSKKRKSQKKDDPGARKGRKVAQHCVFPMICSSGGSKSRLARAAGAEPCGQMKEDETDASGAKHISKSKCTKHLSSGEVEMSKKTPLWREAHFQENVQHTILVLARRHCGAKRISKSKCTNHLMLGPLLEVEMSNKCTPLWCEAHFVVKSAKKCGVWHFWTFRCRFAWQVQGIVDLVKSEQNVRVL